MEMARVLRPGGVVCIMEHNQWNPVTQLIVRRARMDDGAILSSREAARQYAVFAERSQ
jgi:hypothetical protein